MGHSLEVLLSTYAHVMTDLEGAGPVSAEDLILEARRGHILTTSHEKVAATQASEQ